MTHDNFLFRENIKVLYGHRSVEKLTEILKKESFREK